MHSFFDDIKNPLFRLLCQTVNEIGAGFAEIPLAKNFSLPTTDAELCRLSAVLADEELFFLLPENLRQKLSARLKKFPPLYEKNFWRKLRAEKSSGKIFAEKLSVAVKALTLQRKIICGEKILTPYRLEYDLFSDKYFLIVLRVAAFEKILRRARRRSHD